MHANARGVVPTADTAALPAALSIMKTEEAESSPTLPSPLPHSCISLCSLEWSCVRGGRRREARVPEVMEGGTRRTREEGDDLPDDDSA